MEKYKQTRIKLTLLYFGVTFVIVFFFSVFAIQINNSQYEKFNNPKELPGMMGVRFVAIPAEYRDEFLKREDERNEQIQQTIRDAKQDFLTKLVLLDFSILIASAFVSIYLSNETLLPIMDAYNKQQKFVADASHELRTPITAMKTETDVILRSKTATEKDYKDTVESVNEELDVLTRLSSYLLEVAKSDEAKSNFFPEEVNLSKLIEEDLEKFKKIAERNNLNLETKISDDIKLTCDPNRVSQLLRILLDNAVKYNKPNGLIKVVLNKTDSQINLEVVDSGVGIPKEELDKIFDRFYRVTTDRNLKGFGLGLTIAKQIVDEHKANIKVESIEGESTKFTISFVK